MKQVLVIPQPKEIIIQGFAERIRADLQAVTDVDIVEEAQRRLLALEKYVTDKARQDEVRAACRWCELRIGELLPRRSQGERTDLNPDLLNDFNKLLTPQERVSFRQMAESRDIVAGCIENGQVTRTAILAEIRASRRTADYLMDDHLNAKFTPSTEFTRGGLVLNGKVQGYLTADEARSRISNAITAVLKRVRDQDRRSLGEYLQQRAFFLIGRQPEVEGK